MPEWTIGSWQNVLSAKKKLIAKIKRCFMIGGIRMAGKVRSFKAEFLPCRFEVLIYIKITTDGYKDYR